MFSKQNNSTRQLTHVTAGRSEDVPSIIAPDLRIAGNMTCVGSIEIEGEIEGNVTCGQVTIRRTGSVKGDVIADDIHVDGEINGLVKGKTVRLTESGRVTGVIVYETLSIKDGAYIDGQCKSAENLHKGDVEKIALHNSSDEEEPISQMHFEEQKKQSTENIHTMPRRKKSESFAADV